MRTLGEVGVCVVIYQTCNGKQFKLLPARDFINFLNLKLDKAKVHPLPRQKLKRSSCWPGGTEGQYEDRVVRQEDISMGINPALDYLSMPSSVEIKAGAATAN